RDISLVRVTVADPKAMQIISQRTGILRAGHADMPVAAARISEVKIPPEPEKDGAIVLPDRPLPETK
ncbi:hypothetical protein K8R04_05225, partial [Candidatus Uhrbacteria bacterium]|nr:hypothetical protein [Candidatus Uhrbacteria bacterium]